MLHQQYRKLIDLILTAVASVEQLEEVRTDLIIYENQIQQTDCFAVQKQLSERNEQEKKCLNASEQDQINISKQS